MEQTGLMHHPSRDWCDKQNSRMLIGKSGSAEEGAEVRQSLRLLDGISNARVQDGCDEEIVEGKYLRRYAVLPREGREGENQCRRNGRENIQCFARSIGSCVGVLPSSLLGLTLRRDVGMLGDKDKEDTGAEQTCCCCAKDAAQNVDRERRLQIERSANLSGYMEQQSNSGVSGRMRRSQLAAFG